MITSPVVRVTARLLRGNITRAFCFQKGMLDPSKHIFMNHVPHNVYTDYWELGQYPELVLVGSVPSKAYQPKIKSTILETIKARYNVQLSEDDIATEQIQHLLKYVIKTDDSAQNFFNFLLKDLSQKIFVKESKWTWILEQQSRYTAEFNSLILNAQIQTIPDFLAAYNQAIQRMVLVSHLGTDSKIPQTLTPQQKQLFDEMNDEITGINQLQEERPENKNFINRILKIVHGA